jgi:hypothetical protein
MPVLLLFQNLVDFAVEVPCRFDLFGSRASVSVEEARTEGTYSSR